MTERAAAQELLRLRRSNQLIEPASGSDGGPAAVVHRMLALQAQDFGQAVWALGLRCPGTT